MKKWISLFDLCPIRPGMQKDRAARITAMSYLRDCSDKEQRMEKQLLDSSEYILLRGKEGSFTGLLQMVETNPVGRITGQAFNACSRSLCAAILAHLSPCRRAPAK